MRWRPVGLVLIFGALTAAGCRPCPDGAGGSVWTVGSCVAPSPDPAQDACDLTPAAFQPKDGGVPLVVELGTGEDSFVPFPDGGQVTLTRGGQGGTHVWTSVRIFANGADRASVRLTNLPAAGDGGFTDPHDAYPYIRCVGVKPASGSPQERVGLTNFLYAATGEVFIMSLDVASPDGRVGHDERLLQVQ